MVLYLIVVSAVPEWANRQKDDWDISKLKQVPENFLTSLKLKETASNLAFLYTILTLFLEGKCIQQSLQFLIL